MSWKQQKAWNYRAEEWKQSWPRTKEVKTNKEKPKNDGKQQKGKNVPVLVGHDGHKIELDFGDGGSSAGSLSTMSSAMQEENRCLKEAVRFMSSKNDTAAIPDYIKKIVEPDPREKLREQQKELNKARKNLTKVEKIKEDLDKKEASYGRWKNGMAAGLKKAEEIHAKEMQQLRMDLKLAEEGKDVPEEDEDMDLEKEHLAKELDEVKDKMDQMTSYVAAMEQRNQDLVSQVQTLVTAIQTTHKSELWNKDSPQEVHRPSAILPENVDHGALGRVTEFPPSGDYDPRRRSRSPLKRNAETAALGDQDLVKQTEISELLTSLPSEMRDLVNDHMNLEMDKYQEPAEVKKLILIQALADRQQAGLPAAAAIEVEGAMTGTETALMPFRLGGDRMIRRHRTTPLRTPRGLNGMS